MRLGEAWRSLDSRLATVARRLEAHGAWEQQQLTTVPALISVYTVAAGVL